MIFREDYLLLVFMNTFSFGIPLRKLCYHKKRISMCGNWMLPGSTPQSRPIEHFSLAWLHSNLGAGCGNHGHHLNVKSSFGSQSGIDAGQRTD
ncbi:hypothetical protein PR202_gb24098 [Eleusine coracana subsp. coracana]|uniref:Secreted protein n=1 Tax=Eleusine coracana subsp. coracana TaxID=191504 RepID=A0AAV5FM33_ELECO|nr:hypothetical protein PR202_gb24098 [Eleusine coracana subsp. coracana]